MCRFGNLGDDDCLCGGVYCYVNFWWLGSDVMVGLVIWFNIEIWVLVLFYLCVNVFFVDVYFF